MYLLSLIGFAFFVLFTNTVVHDPINWAVLVVVVSLAVDEVRQVSGCTINVLLLNLALLAVLTLIVVTPCSRGNATRLRVEEVYIGKYPCIGDYQNYVRNYKAIFPLTHVNVNAVKRICSEIHLPNYLYSFVTYH